jgi:hypothetical protein
MLGAAAAQLCSRCRHCVGAASFIRCRQ